MPYTVCHLLYPVAHRVNLTSTSSQPGKHHAPILHMARATERQSEWSRVVDRFSKGLGASRVSSRSFLRVIKKKKKKKRRRWMELTGYREARKPNVLPGRVNHRDAQPEGLGFRVTAALCCNARPTSSPCSLPGARANTIRSLSEETETAKECAGVIKQVV